VPLASKHFDESQIALIPKLDDSETIEDKQGILSYCPSTNKINHYREHGLDYNINICSKCELAKTCRLRIERDKAINAKPPLIMAIGSYLSSGKNMVQEWIKDRHLILDEDMIIELLGMHSIKESHLLNFKGLLELTSPIVNTKSLQETVDLLIDNVQKLLDIGLSTIETMEDKECTVIEIDPTLFIFNEDDQKHLGIIQGIFHDLIIRNPKYKNILSTLLSLNKTILISKDHKDFILTTSNPIDLSKTKSITILDATGQEWIYQKVLDLTHPSHKPITTTAYDSIKKQTIYQEATSSYSKYHIRKTLSNTKVQSIITSINHLMETAGYERCYMLTYKNNNDNPIFPNITLIKKQLKNFMEIPNSNIYFGGSVSGHDLIGKHIEETHGDRSKSLQIIFGTPRLGNQTTAQLAYALKLFKPKDIQPAYETDSNRAPILINSKGKTTTISGYLQPVWCLLEHYLIQSQLNQALGRTAPRGIPTLILTNFPFLEENDVTKFTLKTEMQLDQEQPLLQLQSLMKKMINKLSKQKKPLVATKICKKIALHIKRNNELHKELLGFNLLSRNNLELCRDLVNDYKKQSLIHNV
jgi:hypothetical protein